ncbi:MAG: phosphoribosylformylglycinamidine synthase subunit PurL [Candidatus Heimdallarchaeaceae archaeon]
MLTTEEYSKILDVLEREPNKGEVAVFEAMWSEHFSYKSSKRWFHLFNVKAPYIELGIGEGAGLINLGDDLLVGLGLESHNHPSAISPYDGAATGVGGIIRDILSQGCKPIAVLDAIRFGNLEESQHSRYLLENVVRGISFYGNCCGIPTVGGEVEFAPQFENNCLVNAMCVGVVQKNKVVRSMATKPGSFLVLYGARTGRDGIHGVSFASKDLSDKSDRDRPAVQIGDPLMEKILIDVTLELVEKELLDGLQDLGGGGLSCAVSEMAHKGNTGAIIRLEDIYLREDDMEPWEIFVSESQERMLAVVEPSKLDEVVSILNRQDLTYGVIGEVTDNSHCIAYFKGEKIIDLPTELIVDGFPEPERIAEKPDYLEEEDSIIPNIDDLTQEILKLISSPNIGSKAWVYQQYDQHVQTQTVVPAGSDSAVLRLDNGKYIALSLDCNSFMVYLDPYNGTANSAAEAMRNLIATGAKPLAFVDCLNFGNPEHHDSYWQFVESIKGLGQFSHDFDIPVVGGNVSLYNESFIDEKRERINPSPTIGMIGIIDDPEKLIKNSFQEKGAFIVSIGKCDGNLNGSEFLRNNFGILQGKISHYDKQNEEASRKAIESLNQLGYIKSCHDLSNGGLITALAEMTFENKIGVKLNLSNNDTFKKLKPEEFLFAETPSRYLIEIPSEHIENATKIIEGKVSFDIIGKTVDEPIIEIENYISLEIEKMKNAWNKAIPQCMED